MAQRPGLIALTALALAAAPLAASASVFGTNLILNGDAEASEGAPNDSSTVATPFFVVVGAFTPVMYNAPGGFPVTGDPGVAAGGANFFSGGPSNASSSASQVIDISAGFASIDLGTVGFDLSAYLGGYDGQNDNAVLTISFLDAVSAVLGGATLGPVSNLDRGFATGLLFRSTSGFVPVGARSVNVNLQMTRTAGAYNDGYADNLSLVLRGGGDAGVPEPSAWALMLMGFGGLGAALRRRRVVMA
jgi:hypothetical protein